MSDPTLPLARYQPSPFPTLPIVVNVDGHTRHIHAETARRLHRDLAEALRILDVCENPPATP
jgi:hypothetical protein